MADILQKIFKVHFPEANNGILVEMSVNFVHQCPIRNKSVLASYGG